MKFNFQKSIVLVSFLTTSIWMGCKKDETKTDPSVPVLAATTTITAITQTTATSGGNVTADGGSTILARGVCYDTLPSPTFEDDDVTSDGTGTGAFTSSLTDLKPGKKYYVRAYATNIKGVAYGTEVNFTTLASTAVAPTVTTGSTSNILVTGATCAGSISDNGGSGQTITAKGIQYSTSSTLTTSDPKKDGSGPESGFTADLTGLLTNKEYFYRAYATNSGGNTGYGDVKSFTTLGNPPATLTTGNISDVYLYRNASLYNAIATANITNLNGGALVKKGFVWSSTNNNPEIDAKEGQKDTTDGAIGNYTLKIVNLPKLKTIYVRPFVTTNFGGSEVTGYGTTKTIETFVKDVDNNLYNMVKIGSYVWMKENLKTTKFNNGTAITKLNDNTLWASATTSPVYCEPALNPSNVSTYGLLYNHNVANSNVCPVGWVVPTACCNQIDNLFGAAGGSSVAGKNLKAVSSTWNPALPSDATDPLGFSAMPASQREPTGGFVFTVGQTASFWLLEDGGGGSDGWYWSAGFSNSSSASTAKISPKYGMSIRCIK